jgi:multiple sugar transport system ATP-binding protein
MSIVTAERGAPVRSPWARAALAGSDTGVALAEVAFEGVTKRFGDVVAVDDLHLEIADNEFMVLLGPSGCGKTTALRMVAGLDTITEGTLRIGDRVVNNVEAKDRNVSMVFQSYALYPHMTVAKNIESPLIARTFQVDGEEQPRRLHKEERSARVLAAADSLGLTDLLARKPAALSGGQRQRVALARGIVSRPAAFLMDEPLSNLDAKLRAQTRLELVDLYKELGTTFIYVTHDQIEAMTMATRIAIIEKGRLQQVGPPQAVYERPHNLFVARFIGSPPMNTVPATVTVVDGEVFADLGESGRAALAPAGPEPLLEGTKIVIGVRPEHLFIESPNEDRGVTARIVAIEWLGHERHVICDVNGENVVVREAAEGVAPKVGDVTRLRVDPGHVHLFDPATTERIN